MPVLNLAYIAELAFKYARKFLVAFKIVVFVLILASLFAAFVIAFTEFYNLVTFTLQLATNGSYGDSVAKMFGLMSCMGLTQAFNDTKAFLISSFTFLFVKILYVQVISIYYMILRSIEPLIK